MMPKRDVSFLQNDNVMGVDLGIKCPAVSIVQVEVSSFMEMGEKQIYKKTLQIIFEKDFTKSKEPKADC